PQQGEESENSGQQRKKSRAEKQCLPKGSAALEKKLKQCPPADLGNSVRKKNQECARQGPEVVRLIRPLRQSIEKLPQRTGEQTGDTGYSNSPSGKYGGNAWVRSAQRISNIPEPLSR